MRKARFLMRNSKPPSTASLDTDTPGECFTRNDDDDGRAAFMRQSLIDEYSIDRA